MKAFHIAWNNLLGVAGIKATGTAITTTYPPASQGNYKEAKALIKRSLDIGRRVLGPDHPDYATGLTNLAMLLQKQVRVDPFERKQF